jgi:hypothetical protein
MSDIRYLETIGELAAGFHEACRFGYLISGI